MATIQSILGILVPIITSWTCNRYWPVNPKKQNKSDNRNECLGILKKNGHEHLLDCCMAILKTPR